MPDVVTAVLVIARKKHVEVNLLGEEATTTLYLSPIIRYSAVDSWLRREHMGKGVALKVPKVRACRVVYYPRVKDAVRCHHDDLIGSALHEFKEAGASTGSYLARPKVTLKRWQTVAVANTLRELAIQAIDAQLDALLSGVALRLEGPSVGVQVLYELEWKLAAYRLSKGPSLADGDLIVVLQCLLYLARMIPTSPV